MHNTGSDYRQNSIREQLMYHHSQMKTVQNSKRLTQPAMHMKSETKAYADRLGNDSEQSEIFQMIDNHS